jgi:ABC-type multidrug transport system fused ATPase/permease subunit
MIFFIKQLHLIQLFSSNIETIQKGIGIDFVLMKVKLFSVIGSLMSSFLINWQLALIMICIIPFVFGSTFIFGKVCMIVQSVKLS